MKFFSTLAALAVVATSVEAFSFYAYSKDNFGGTLKYYDTSGKHTPGFTIKSYHWVSPGGDDCCAIWCKGSTKVGYYCPSHSSPSSSAGTTHIRIGCGDTTLKC